jgi:hypothetical protein
MTTYPCPYQDNGICIPPVAGDMQAILVWDGTISFVAGRLVEELAQQVPVYAEVEAVDQYFIPSLIRGFAEMARRAAPGEFPAALSVDALQIDAPSSGKWLYFQCAPCGHTVKTEIN